MNMMTCGRFVVLHSRFSWFQVIAVVGFFHGGEPSFWVGRCCCCASGACTGPRHSVLYDHQEISSQYSIFLFLFRRGTQRLHVVHLLLYLCLALGATRLPKQCPFHPPVQRILSYLLVFTSDTRIISLVNRIILTDNCYGTPWGNAVVLCGLLDGVR